MISSSSSLRFRLWVDGCGGFLLVLGDQVRIGRGDNSSVILAQSPSQANKNEVAIQADLPSHAGILHRRAEDYFWVVDESDAWIESGAMIPVSGSARLTLTCVSPLTSTAMLSLAPPHRFHGHIDQVALVSEVLLVGPKADCHIQTPQLSHTTLLRWSCGQWQKRDLRSCNDSSNAWRDLPVGESFAIEGVSMMLETV